MQGETPRSQNTCSQDVGRNHISVVGAYACFSNGCQGARSLHFFVYNQIISWQRLKATVIDIKAEKSFLSYFVLSSGLLHDGTACFLQQFIVTSNLETPVWNSELKTYSAKLLHYLFLVVSFSSFKMLVLVSWLQAFFSCTCLTFYEFLLGFYEWC